MNAIEWNMTHLESGSGFEGCSRQDADQLVERGALLLELSGGIGRIVAEGPAHVDDALPIAGVLEEVLHQWHVAPNVHDVVREHFVEVHGLELVRILGPKDGRSLPLTAQYRLREARVHAGRHDPVELEHHGPTTRARSTNTTTSER